MFFKSTSRLFSSSSLCKAQVEVFINDKSVLIEQGSAVIQACEAAGVDIPRFCYHERLAIAGNCRMCLVEVEKVAKPVASCAMPVTPGMKIKTDTPLVKKAREGVMEFLLANHPLDCPICDQGGECDLQDQSVRYGSDRSRFSEVVGKRATENKDLGPLVKTVMTRCIHCTRCVRFANEVAGAAELGTSGRGNDMQIGTYIEKTLNTEMSGNIVDLCPVGALTSKPYTFTSRPWELKKTESIDVLDAIGSNIRIDSRGVEVMRIQPRVNDDVNEEWISDKSRYAYDGLKTQRLLTPMIKQGNEFVPSTWPEALQLISENLKSTKPSQAVGVAGNLADAESLVALKDWMNKFGSENLVVESHGKTDLPGTFDIRSNYTLNAGISGVEEADVILLVGTNPRHEAPILNTRIRKGYLNNNLQIGLVGDAPELNYEFQHLGSDPSVLEKILDKKSSFSKILSTAKKPLILVGSSIYERADSSAILSSLVHVVEKLQKHTEPGWTILNVLQRAASWTAAFDIGYTPSSVPLSSAKFIYLLNADEVTDSMIPKDAFVVYQGHHGDVGAQYANVILPGSAYTEKSATFVNTEGRSQVTRAAVPPPSAAREDWKILRALSQLSGYTLPYDDIESLTARMDSISPSLAKHDSWQRTDSALVHLGLDYLRSFKGKPSTLSFELSIKDFYLTDPISRASSTMAKCSKAFTFKEKDNTPVLAHQST